MAEPEEPTFTPEARQRWEAIPPEFQELALRSVWCGRCLGAVSMELKNASVSKDLLVLEGTCLQCGKRVVRCVEPSE